MKSLFLGAALAVSVLWLTSPSALGQTLYGVEGGGARLWEFTTAAGPPCPQPTAVRAACSYVTPVCGIPAPGVFADPPLGLLGDVATNRLTDTVYVTDGRVIEEYVGDTPCGVPPPCTPLNSFMVPTGLGMGPITGMGMDPTGTLTAGAPTLWITDGVLIAGIVPGPCIATVAFPPCAPAAGIFLTDLSWNTGPAFGPGLWASDAGGMVHFIPMPACGIGFSFAPANCALVPPLTGIAYDTGTPNLVTGQADSLYVTDGFRVEYIDLTTLGAATSFYSPVACSPTNAPMAGLAYTAHAINYGFSRVAMSIGSFGQSSTPGPTFGIELIGAPAGDNIWMLLNFNFQPPGFVCPPVFGAGTLFWVSAAPPGILLNLGPLPGGCVPIPLPIPAATPIGIQFFFQFFAVPLTGPPATDATGGLEYTIVVP